MAKTFKIDTVMEIPDFVSPGKWDELRNEIANMAVGQIVRVTLENRQDAQGAQSAVNSGSNNGKYGMRSKGYYFMTRTRPMDNNKEGKWFLFIKRIEKPVRG
jgi:hypothetical protein